MAFTLCKIYLKDTNHHLHLDNNSLCSQYTNVSSITLRSGKELSQKQAMSKIAKWKAVQSIISDPDIDVVVQAQNQSRTIPLLFPSRVVQVEKFEIDDELLQTFSKVDSIPLLDAIRPIPKYTKFLKELFINKRKKLKGDVEVGINVSTLIKMSKFLFWFSLLCQRSVVILALFLFHEL
ncbi:hypothetical protein CR513_34105, partial [Mucuna pruriens]